MKKFKTIDAEIYSRISEISAKMEVILEKHQAFLNKNKVPKFSEKVSQPKLSAAGKTAKPFKINGTNIAAQRCKASASSTTRNKVKNRKPKLTHLQQLILILRKDKPSA